MKDVQPVKINLLFTIVAKSQRERSGRCRLMDPQRFEKTTEPIMA